MSTLQSQSSWWERAPREGFSESCIVRFGVNFDNAPTLIVRSEFIKTKGSASHHLQQHVIPTAREANAARGRKVSRTKHIGTRMSARAMQSSGSMVGN